MKTREKGAGLVDLRSQPFIFFDRSVLTYPLTYQSLLAYLALTVACGRESFCDGSSKTLAKIARLGKTSFRKGVAQLESHCIVRVERRTGQPYGYRAPMNLENRYHLLDFQPYREDKVIARLNLNRRVVDESAQV